MAKLFDDQRLSTTPINVKLKDSKFLDETMNETGFQEQRTMIYPGHQEESLVEFNPFENIEHLNLNKPNFETLLDDELSLTSAPKYESADQGQRQMTYFGHQEITPSKFKPLEDIEYLKFIESNSKTVCDTKLMLKSYLPMEILCATVAPGKRKVANSRHLDVTSPKFKPAGDTEHMNSIKSNLDTLFQYSPSMLKLDDQNSELSIKETNDEHHKEEGYKVYNELSNPKLNHFQFAHLESVKNGIDNKFDADLLSQSPLKLHKTVSNDESIKSNVAAEFLKIEQDLAANLLGIDYTDTKVKFISNPIEHAIEPHTNFLETYLDGSKSILFLGMNPGPWGMCQTGVPFGEVQSCKNWLNISGNVTKTTSTHPKRPIEGFACRRREVSGERFWKFFSSKCGNPRTFFKNCFVYNHCPLAYMTETGKNITPPEIKGETKSQINSFCDKALVDVIRLLGVSYVVGVGKFAEARAKAIKKKFDMDITVFFLLHPSPASPAANKGWSEIAETSLKNMNILDFL